MSNSTSPFNIVGISHMFLFSGIMLFGGWAMSHLEPRLPVAVEWKLNKIEKTAEPYNLLFLGNSVIHHHLNPEIFDDGLAKRGVDVHSYNGAIAGMGSLEMDAFLRRILDSDLPNLKWIIMSAYNYLPEIEPERQFTDRHVWCHDFRGTCFVLYSIWMKHENGIVDGVYWSYIHLLHFGKYLYRTGEWEAIVQYYAGFKKTFREPDYDIRGFAPLDPMRDDVLPRHLSFLYGNMEDRFTFIEMSATNFTDAAINDTRLTMDDLHRSYKIEQKENKELLESRGIELYYYLPPVSDNLEKWRQLKEQGLVDNLLDFNNPQKYPDLYDVDLRLDRLHLNHIGADIQSALIAEIFFDQEFGGTVQ